MIKSVLKRIFILSLLILFKIAFVFCEESSDVYKQYQMFSWKAVKNVSKYELNAELKDEEGNYNPAESVQTRKSSCELLLLPGEYRISITPFNKIGRRGNASPWIYFTILNETEPYLYADYLKISPSWKCPLLHISTIDDSDEYDEDDYELYEDEGISLEDEEESSIESADGDPENSFLLKAKNVYFPDTRFYLKPVDKAPDNASEYVSFNKRRHNSSLEIVRRDREHDGIVVSYNPDELYSGYYDIVVENPGNKSASLTILILTDRALVMEDASFDYDEDYHVNSITLSRSRRSSFKLTGSGFDSSTQFSLVPASEGIEYPFASSREREKILLKPENVVTTDDNGRMNIDFFVEPDKIHAGYYRLKAVGNNGASVSKLLLVKTESDAVNQKPAITKIKSDFDKANNSIIFTMNGENLKGTDLYLISPFSMETGKNERYPMNLLEIRMGSKFIYDVNNADISEGNYAILMENDASENVNYISVNKKYKTSLIKDEEKIEDAKKDVMISKDYDVTRIGEKQLPLSVNVIPQVASVSGRFKFLFPLFYLDFEIRPDETPTGLVPGIVYTVFNLGPLMYKAGLYYDINRYSLNPRLMLELYNPLSDNFQIYAAAGAEMVLTENRDFLNVNGDYLNYVDYLLGKTTLEDESVLPFNWKINGKASIGAVVLQLLNFNYTVTLNNVENSEKPMYFSDSFSVGCRFQLRQKKYKKKYKGSAAVISKTGKVSGKDCNLNKKETVMITFENGITEISDFGNMPALESVILPETLKVLDTDVFRNNTSLESIALPDGLEVIRSGAFADCGFDEITIPSSIRVIEKNIFSNDGRTPFLTLEWDEEDKTERDLSGLNDSSLFVYYKNGYRYYPK